MGPGPAQQFIEDVLAAADPARAERDRKYHKSTRPHWGITMPQLDYVVKRHAGRHPPEHLLRLASQLWNSGVYDLMTAAARIPGPPGNSSFTASLADPRRLAGGRGRPGRWRTSWPRPPGSACCTIPRCWTTWNAGRSTPTSGARRAVLIYTLPYAKPGRDPERVLGWAAAYAADPEWFIQKAIGWWLRELSRHDGPRVVRFLRSHWHQLQGVARKEARRRLDAESARRLLDFLQGNDQTSGAP